MPEVKRKNIYESLPLIYNHLMRRIRYDYWADYLFHLTSKYVSTQATVLELAGGNCKLAEFMRKKYPHIIVSDLSAEMLASSEDTTLSKVCCDMLFPPFKKTFDLIYITFDSINYLLTKKKMLLFFNGIKSLLRDNGIFAFDASLERNSISHISQPVRKARYNGYNYVHKSTYDKGTRIHKNVFNIIFPDGVVYKEVHKQKILEYYDYFDLIEKAGLYVVECFDAFTFNNGKASSKRVQFVVKKA
jgi:SAM-dependent methyltransferase